MVCRLMRYREIPASSASVCRKSRIDYDIPRHRYFNKLCSILKGCCEATSLENGQPKDAAIAAQQQHFHIQPKNRTCEPFRVNGFWVIFTDPETGIVLVDILYPLCAKDLRGISILPLRSTTFRHGAVGFHEPLALFKPKISLLPANQAGETVTFSA